MFDREARVFLYKKWSVDSDKCVDSDKGLDSDGSFDSEGRSLGNHEVEFQMFDREARVFLYKKWTDSIDNLAGLRDVYLDTLVQTLCKHTYCLHCFENYCESAASTSKNKFRIECQGESGNCAEVFSLAELKDRLSSSAFELVLKSSFEEYVQRHPKDFHYCPTPDCGYVYRCTSASNSKPPAYTCPNCLEPICTFCHARHGNYTCAEYKDIESGGYEALEKLKRELNIKDCPKCKTPMEKTEGCNHMT